MSMQEIKTSLERASSKTGYTIN